MDTAMSQPYSIPSAIGFDSFSPITGFGPVATYMIDESIESTSPGSFDGTNYDIQPEESYIMPDQSSSDFGSSFVDDTEGRITDLTAPINFSFSSDTAATIGHAHFAELANQFLNTSRPRANDTRLSIPNSSGSPSTSFLGTQNVPDQFVTTEDSMEGSGLGSPTSSNGKTEFREHEYYHRSPGRDGKYYCPVEDCNWIPKMLKCEYHKHIDSHIKPFKCRHPSCSNLCFSSMACQLRHEREMHKMHAAMEHPCRFEGECDRKNPGNGFARSYNRSDHEKRVHGMKPNNTRTKSQAKKSGSSPSGLRSPGRRPDASRMPSNYTSLSSSDASSSTASSPNASRSSNLPGSHSLSRLSNLASPTSATNYPTEDFVSHANLHMGSPYNGGSYSGMPSASSRATAMVRRSSAGPTGIERRRPRTPSSPSLDHQFSQLFQAFQDYTSNLPSTRDRSELLVLKSYLDEITRQSG